jgi:hypothetical protein
VKKYKVDQFYAQTQDVHYETLEEAIEAANKKRSTVATIGAHIAVYELIDVLIPKPTHVWQSEQNEKRN